MVNNWAVVLQFVLKFAYASTVFFPYSLHHYRYHRLLITVGW